MPRKRRPSEGGIGAADYAAALEAQGGVCALCRLPPKTRRLDQDHDHRTHAFRGLLCARCNRALGLVERYGFGPVWLERAIAYLSGGV